MPIVRALAAANQIAARRRYAAAPQNLKTLTKGARMRTWVLAVRIVATWRWHLTIIQHADVRRRFAEAVFGVYQEGDVVWVQDYHLMLLPALLKKQRPKMKVRLPCASLL